MPLGTDAVIPLEEYELAGQAASLKAEASAAPYRNVQRRGSDSQPGAPMLTAGVRLGAAEIAVAASAGLASVRVARQPALMVISTGDELIEPGLPIAEHQVRRSNAYAVVAALRDHGFDQVANDHLADDEEVLRQRLAQHLARHDALILSGGVSKGKFDLVPKVLKQLGVEEVFYQVAQRPGMPMWFGVGAARPAGVRTAGQPRVHADLPATLCAAGDGCRHGRAAHAARTDRPGGAGEVWARHDLLHAGGGHAR